MLDGWMMGRDQLVFLRYPIYYYSATRVGRFHFPWCETSLHCRGDVLNTLWSKSLIVFTHDLLLGPSSPSL